jgi:subtilisin family serine protease
MDNMQQSDAKLGGPTLKTRNTLITRLWVGIVAGAAATSAMAPSALAAKPKLWGSATLERPVVPGELLVRFTNEALASGQATRVNALARGRGTKTFRALTMQRVKLDPSMSIAEAVKVYSGQSAVLSVQPNYRYQLLDDGDTFFGKKKKKPPTEEPGTGTGTKPPKPPSTKPNDNLYGQQWALPKIQAPAAWSVTTGSPSVIVAVIDSGVNYQHEDLKGNMWTNTREVPGNGRDDDGNGYIDDFYGIDTENEDSDPRDDVGHGTHVAGTIGAVGNNKLGVTGVNWQVRIMAIKAGLTSAGLVEAIEYMIMMKKRGQNVRVANHSYGGFNTAGTALNQFDPGLKAAFDAAGTAGILNAVAAGNGGTDQLGDDNDTQFSYPTNYSSPSIIAVAATNRSDKLTRFSNYGFRTVDIGAPGEEILSTYPYEQLTVKDPTTGDKSKVDGAYSNKAYRELDGTSMAAPHVAGAAALMFAAKPNLTVKQVKTSLYNGTDTSTYLATRLQSHGRLNIARSLVDIGVPIVGIDNPPGTPDMLKPGVETGDGDDGNEPPGDGTPTPTPTPEIPDYQNGNTVYTEDNTGFFPTINQLGPTGGSTILIGGQIQLMQNPYISLRTGRVAFVVDLANVTRDPAAFGDRDRFGTAATYVFPEQEIFVRNVDDSVIRITNDEANGIAPVSDREPAISPDGTRIVFVKRRANGNDDIYITSALQDLSRPGATPRQFLLVGDVNTSSPSQDSRPYWSPDGKRIVFQSNRGALRTGQT